MSEIHKILHRLWGKAVDSPGYVKLDWCDLQRYIDEQEAKTMIVEIKNDTNGSTVTRREKLDV